MFASQRKVDDQEHKILIGGRRFGFLVMVIGFFLSAGARRGRLGRQRHRARLGQRGGAGAQARTEGTVTKGAVTNSADFAQTRPILCKIGKRNGLTPPFNYQQI